MIAWLGIIKTALKDVQAFKLSGTLNHDDIRKVGVEEEWRNP